MRRGRQAIVLAGVGLTAVGVIGLALAPALGRIGGPVTAVAGLAAIVAAWRLVAREEGWLLVALVASYGVRVATIGFVTLGAGIVGRQPWLFGDESGYAEFAGFSYDAIRRGAPIDRVLAGHGVVGANPYVDAQTIAYMVFGGPDLGVMRVLNALFGVLTALIAFDLARRLFDRRAAWIAAVMLLLLPSLFVWSIVNLRESSVALALLVSIWWVERMRVRPHPAWLALGIFDIALLQGLRTLLFYLVSVPFTINVLTGLRQLALRWRVTATVLAVVLGPGLMMERSGEGWFGVGLMRPSTLTIVEQSRSFMALGARTAFGVTPSISADALVLPPNVPIRIELPSKTGPVSLSTLPPGPETPGPTAPIELPSKTGPVSLSTLPPGPETPGPTAPPAPTPPPSPTPTPIVVQPGQQLVLVTEQNVSPSPDPAKVFVRPGDVVVLQQGPARTLDPRPLIVNFGDQEFLQVQAPADTSTAGRLLHIASLAPIGLLYLALAPFPGLTATGIEWPALIETIPWSLALLAAAVTLVVRWRRWLDLVGIGSYAIAIVFMTSVVEGNVGTLVRHRAMAVPLVVVLAAPTFWTAWTTIRPFVTRAVRYVSRTMPPRMP